MASSSTTPNDRSQQRRRNEYNDSHEESSLDLDVSAAMSLDESTIHLNATSAATPLSVDMTGASFARPARGPGCVGRRFHNPAFTDAVASPILSPSMSLSGMDMTMVSTKGSGGSGGAAAQLNGDAGKRKIDHPNAQVAFNDRSANGNESGGVENSATENKKRLNLNLSTLHSYNTHGTCDDDAAANSNPQYLSFKWNSEWDLGGARARLRQASTECSRRGLKLASRWASEQLMGLAAHPPPGDCRDQELQTAEDGGFFSEECCQPTDVELYAMSLFDLGEYSRAAHVLSVNGDAASHGASSSTHHTNSSDETSLCQINPPQKTLTCLGIYLRAFSLYLSGERRRQEQVTELRDPLERTSLHNANLPRLEAELRAAYRSEKLDAFGMYVYGVVLKGLRGTKLAPRLRGASCSARPGNCNTADDQESDEHTAHQMLVRSILLYPFNWSAWLDLGELCADDPSIDQEVEELLLPIANHWMYHFFCVHVFIENKANENAIAIIEKLANGNTAVAEEEEEEGDMTQGEHEYMSPSGFFVQSPYLQSQLAMAYYDVRDYDSAHEHFLALSEREPYRLDHMDAFSNVLYVKDQKVALSHLAHRSVTVDKYRPETCIIVGNYYSSKGRHEKAVQYFQRALKLDPTYLSAWTLLGHEYIEMKNTAAAIEAYRRAVDISDREYRAWYGLGQTYEIMNMLLHALFYFRKAAALHPHDARMWCAIGGCLLGLDRRTDAEKSYERAVSLGDGEGIATRKLAELYREDGDEEKAARCYLRHLELRYQSQLPGSYLTDNADMSPTAFENVITHVRVDEPEAEALLYLAYYYRDNLEYDQAILCATRLEDYPGPEKEQGKGLLRDIRSRMDQKATEKRQGMSTTLSPSTPGVQLRSRRDISMSSKSVTNAESSFEFSP